MAYIPGIPSNIPVINKGKTGSYSQIIGALYVFYINKLRSL